MPWVGLVWKRVPNKRFRQMMGGDITVEASPAKTCDPPAGKFRTRPDLK
jgi:hypothetical protein